MDERRDLTHPMTPMLLLALLVGATVAAVVVDAGRRAKRHHAARRLAADWRMNYGRADSLGLTARVGPLLPAPGAAAVRVSDVVYGARGDAARYVFTVEYTTGVTGSKRRHVRAAALTEPRDRRPGGAKLVLGDPDVPLPDQYVALAPEDVTDVNGATENTMALRSPLPRTRGRGLG